MTFDTDPVARDIALRRWVLPECLHVPIAAVDQDAITTYIGEIAQVLSRGEPNRALLVRAKEPPPIDRTLPIWELDGAAVLHQRMQVWVHVRYSRYRSAYRRAFPDEDIAGKVLSHAMNRRTAILKGFDYVRLTPVSRGSNSSSAFSENWAVAMYGGPGQTPEKARRGSKAPDRTGARRINSCRSGFKGKEVSHDNEQAGLSRPGAGAGLARGNGRQAE